MAIKARHHKKRRVALALKTGDWTAVENSGSVQGRKQKLRTPEKKPNLKWLRLLLIGDTPLIAVRWRLINASFYCIPGD